MPKGQRIKSGFMWIQVEGMWWQYSTNTWVKDTSRLSSNCSNRCRTIRAFHRHLRKHPEIRGKYVTLRHREYMITKNGHHHNMDVSVGKSAS